MVKLAVSPEVTVILEGCVVTDGSVKTVTEGDVNAVPDSVPSPEMTVTVILSPTLPFPATLRFSVEPVAPAIATPFLFH